MLGDWFRGGSFETGVGGAGGGDFKSSLADCLRSVCSLTVPRPACSNSILKSCILVGRTGPRRSLAQLRRSPGDAADGEPRVVDVGDGDENERSPAQLFLSPGKQRGERDLGLKIPVSGGRALVLPVLFREETLNAGELERDEAGESDRSKSVFTFIFFFDWCMTANRSSVDMVVLGGFTSFQTSSGPSSLLGPLPLGDVGARLTEVGVEEATQTESGGAAAGGSPCSEGAAF